MENACYLRVSYGALSYEKMALALPRLIKGLRQLTEINQ